MYKLNDAILMAKRRFAQLKFMHIGKEDLVVDIGSGCTPNLRANVLCDRYLLNNVERDNNPFYIGPGQITIICEATQLPFRDKTFDYSICSHLLEHIEGPAKLLNELQRISKAGYIEIPSEEAEYLFGRPWHYWIGEIKNGVLILTPKDKPVLNQKLTDWYCWLIKQNKFFLRELHMKPYKYRLTTALEWKGVINYRINAEKDFKFSWSKEGFKQEAAQFSNMQKTARKFHLLGRFYGRIIRNKSKKRLPPLYELIVCPVCKSKLEPGSVIRCSQCGRTFPVRNGIPFLI